MTRNIENIFEPPPHHWVGNGFRVHNFFPGGPRIGLKRMSPFFLCDYNSKHTFPPSNVPRGVGSHPHRGIETVTIAYHGKVAHHDSVGNSGIIGENDVQWMTAGGGILHKEYHENEFNNKGGLFQMVQLWTNLPSKHKMTPAKYQDLLYRDAAIFNSDNRKVSMNIIAGEYKNIGGKADILMPLNLFDLSLASNSSVEFNFDPKHNTGFLVIEGNVRVNDRNDVPEDNFILFKNEPGRIVIKANKNSKVLIMNGEPIDEPIAPYGPFVMNTQDEIQQAIEDFNNGKFGHLD